jgi:hypothetical protein
MSRKNLWRGSLAALIALMLTFQPASAHEHITIGDYELVIGWVDEPPIVGQLNAIIVNVTNTGSGAAQPVEDVSSLTVTVSYGGQTKALTLQSFGDDTSGQFMAPLMPTVPGEYTIILGGQLGETPVDAEVHPEEVEPEDTLQFPGVEPPEQNTDPGSSDWLTWIAILLGLIGVGLGVNAHRKVR